MSDLTLEEKQSYAANRAKHEEAEKHFFDLNQPFFPFGFSANYRNPGHWDIYAQSCPGKASAFLSLSERNFTTERDGDKERAFRIRGEPGNVVIFDERWDPHRPHPRVALKFKSVTGAMLWIVEEMMQEPSQKTI